MKYLKCLTLCFFSCGLQRKNQKCRRENLVIMYRLVNSKPVHDKESMKKHEKQVEHYHNNLLGTFKAITTPSVNSRPPSRPSTLKGKLFSNTPRHRRIKLSIPIDEAEPHHDANLELSAEGKKQLVMMTVIPDDAESSDIPLSLAGSTTPAGTAAYDAEPSSISLLDGSSITFLNDGLEESGGLANDGCCSSAVASTDNSIGEHSTSNGLSAMLLGCQQLKVDNNNDSGAVAIDNAAGTNSVDHQDANLLLTGSENQANMPEHQPNGTFENTEEYELEYEQDDDADASDPVVQKVDDLSQSADNKQDAGNCLGSANAHEEML